MMDKKIIVPLALAHGTFNLIVVTFFMYQGWLGWSMRKGRREKRQIDFKVVKRHRKIGPILLILAFIGYLAGEGLVCFDQGHVVKYPLHFSVGTVIMVAIFTTFLISRKIKTPGSPWRTPHYALGVVIICLYLIQAFLGLQMVF
jgi:cytochrome b561